MVYYRQLSIDSGITLAALVEGSLTMLPQALSTKQSMDCNGGLQSQGVPVWRSFGVASVVETFGEKDKFFVEPPG